MGAGGSARAVVYGLARAGWEVRLLARRAEQAAQLISAMQALEELRGVVLCSGALDEAALLRLAPGCRLVVNTTPLGMFPHPEASPWPAAIPWPEGAGVYDLVYNPPETLFARSARLAGLAARTGGGMLSAQAALAFARWTGQEPPFEVMYKEIS